MIDRPPYNGQCIPSRERHEPVLVRLDTFKCISNQRGFPGQLPPNARVRYMEASFTTPKNHLNNQLESIGFKSQITPTLELPSFYAQDHERCVTHRIFSRSTFVSMTCDPCVFVLTRRKEFVDSNGVVNTIAPSGAIFTSPLGKRRKLTPPPCERIMIYVRQENEVAFTPLHLLPPTSLGLLDAVSPPSSPPPPPEPPYSGQS